jgi:hypothetical protein
MPAGGCLTLVAPAPIVPKLYTVAEVLALWPEGARFDAWERYLEREAANSRERTAAAIEYRRKDFRKRYQRKKAEMAG